VIDAVRLVGDPSQTPLQRWLAGPGYDDTLGFTAVVLLLVVLLAWPVLTTVLDWRRRRAARRRTDL
jgi:hypothetical protein